MVKTAVALRHIHFEDLGSFGPALAAAGYEVRHHDAVAGDPAALDPLGPDLLVVLGGPVGVYEADAYPFLAAERAMIARRLAARRPTLGICLGAQLMAAALGAEVRPTGVKEIGFAPLDLTDAGRRGPLRHLDGVPVLHWHGDAFAIPEGAEGLATTPLCATQGFALGPAILGLQFHPEADAEAGLERWLVGHACELAGAGIDPRTLRADAARYGRGLREAATAMLSAWLAGLEGRA